MPRHVDVSGVRFGRLVALERSATASPNRSYSWRCQCDCGAIAEINIRYLRNGDTRSCGCLKADSTRSTMTTHGHTVGGKSKTYQSWKAMRLRCTSPRSTYFSLYGGRGITICDRWNSFENFLEDMGERPCGSTIDRIDRNGNYEPRNCRWATAAEQVQNSSKARICADTAREILGRYEHGERQVSIARRLGLGKGIVSAVVTGRTWKNIRDEAGQ